MSRLEMGSVIFRGPLDAWNALRIGWGSRMEPSMAPGAFPCHGGYGLMARSGEIAWD